MSTEERSYDVIEPITWDVLEDAAKALGTTATDILERPSETLAELEPTIGQQQAFCEVALQEFDLNLRDLPVLEGRAFFTVVFRSFFAELSGLDRMLSAVLKASGILPARPDGGRFSAEKTPSP